MKENVTKTSAERQKRYRERKKALQNPENVTQEVESVTQNVTLLPFDELPSDPEKRIAYIREKLSLQRVYSPMGERLLRDIEAGAEFHAKFNPNIDSADISKRYENAYKYLLSRQ